MSNPVFRRHGVFTTGGAYRPPANSVNQASTMTSPGMDAATLAQAYQSAPATPYHTGRMTYDDVIVKTMGLLGILIVAGAATWVLMPMAAIPAGLVGLVLGLVCAFKREPNRGLIIAYAVAEGAFLGGLSRIFEAAWSGIVLQAVVATLAVFAVVLVLYKSGKIRTSPKLTRFVVTAMLGYVVFSLVNAALVWFGVLPDFGMRSVEVAGMPLGIIISIVAVLLGAYSFMIDFDYIKAGVEGGAPGRYAWTAAFGLTVTLVWLYLEFLRLLSYFRD
jgi:uncharacterized YccA/Bax inhibitor family protein